MYWLPACCAALCANSRTKAPGCGELMMASRFMQLRLLVGQVPGHGAAPVVRHQAFQRAAGAFVGDQRDQVLHQMFGAVGLHLGGAAGGAKPAQVGRHAAVAAVFGAGKCSSSSSQMKAPSGSRAKTAAPGAPPRRWYAAVQGGAVGQGNGDGAGSLRYASIK